MLEGDKLQTEVRWNEVDFPLLEPRETGHQVRSLNDSLHSELFSIMHYLDTYHGFDALEPWFSQDMDQMLSTVNQDKLKWQRMEETELYIKTMGLPYPPVPSDPTGRYYSFQLESPQLPTPVTGYDYIVDFHINEFDEKRFTLGGSNYQLGFNKAADGLLLEAEGDSLHVPLEPMVKGLIERQGEDHFKDSYAMVQPEIINREGLDLLLKFEIRHINFQHVKEGKMRLQFISGFLLIKEK